VDQSFLGELADAIEEIYAYGSFESYMDAFAESSSKQDLFWLGLLCGFNIRGKVEIMLLTPKPRQISIMPGTGLRRISHFGLGCMEQCLLT